MPHCSLVIHACLQRKYRKRALEWRGGRKAASVDNDLITVMFVNSKSARLTDGRSLGCFALRWREGETTNQTSISRGNLHTAYVQRPQVLSPTVLWPNKVLRRCYVGVQEGAIPPLPTASFLSSNPNSLHYVLHLSVRIITESARLGMEKLPAGSANGDLRLHKT